ncbi:hypothetical protein HDU89_008299 [Geranomyces variabilis]|nr:hypothetical protein HDU89_008299 [Geranomyces variabilis]
MPGFGGGPPRQYEQPAAPETVSAPNPFSELPRSNRARHEEAAVEELSSSAPAEVRPRNDWGAVDLQNHDPVEEAPTRQSALKDPIEKEPRHKEKKQHEKDKSGYRADRQRADKAPARTGKDKDRERRDQQQRSQGQKGKKDSYASADASKKVKKTAVPVERDIVLPHGISVVNLSSLMGVPYPQLARRMANLGMENTEASFVLNSEAAAMLVIEYGMNPIVPIVSEADVVARPEPEDWSTFESRPPVVTIMGHVDHGKTTLLDALRKTSVAAGEAGGITQHIGAFSVLLPSQKRITFLDTPGHAAFSAMRARGAQVTDIVVLVVAADDGVMPQTVEAIKHSLKANVPIVVAINKCDKPDTNIRKLKESLLRHEVVLEEYGGDIPAVEVSALTGKGLDELEETIVAIAEVMDIRGDATGAVEGTVVEAKLVRGKGNVATVLVRRGTLTPGTVVVAGTTWSKVRVMHDERGNEIPNAGPSMPVEVMGWRELPAAGDEVLGIDALSAKALMGPPRKESDVPKQILEAAKTVADARAARLAHAAAVEDVRLLNEKRIKEKAAAAEPQDATDALGEKAAVVGPAVPVLNVVLKTDVHGSLEAIVDAIAGLPVHEARVAVVASGVGAVTDSDVDVAIATKSMILSFNMPADKRTSARAASAHVPIHAHTIIYKLLDDLKDVLSDLLPPDVSSVVNGEAEVLQVFRINTKGKATEAVGGCRVATGKITRANSVRIVRNGEVIYDGKLKTFKHHKKDINEASKGLECGMGFEGFEGIEEGDTIQAYTTVTKKRRIS